MMSKKYILLSIVVFCLNCIVIAQDGFNIPAITSCYQNIDVESDKSVKVLRSNGQNKITLKDIGGLYRFHQFHVWGFNSTNNVWQSIDFTGQFVQGPNVPVIFPGTVNDIWYKYTWKQAPNFESELDLTGYDKIVIDLFENTQGPPGGPIVIMNVYKNFQVEFVDGEEVIEIEPAGGSTCFSFNDFNFQSALDTQFEGFCGFQTDFKLKLPPGAVSTNGLPQGFEETVKEGVPEDIGPTDCDDPNAVQCPQAPANYPDPVPCRCIEMNLEFTIMPCSEHIGDPDCPPIKVLKTIEVCCKCDTRANNGIEGG